MERMGKTMEKQQANKSWFSSWWSNPPADEEKTGSDSTSSLGSYKFNLFITTLIIDIF